MMNLWRQNQQTENQSKTQLLSIAAACITIAFFAAVLVLRFGNAEAIRPSAAETRVQTWVNTLSTDSLTVDRQDGMQQLEEAGDLSVDPLVAALHSNNAVLRRNAADMLGYIASPRSAQALDNLLNTDAVPAVRRNAAWALGEIKDLHYVSDLERATILDRNQTVRSVAADSLDRIRSVLARSAGISELDLTGVAVSPIDPDVVYLASGRNISISGDGGKSWAIVPDTLPSAASTLAISPSNPNVLYAGIDGMGLYKSTNAGYSWNRVDTNLGFTPGALMRITAITFDTTNPKRIIVAKGVLLGTQVVEFHSQGVAESLDGGVTWHAVDAGTNTDPITRMWLNDENLYALAAGRVLVIPMKNFQSLFELKLLNGSL